MPASKIQKPKKTTLKMSRAKVIAANKELWLTRKENALKTGDYNPHYSFYGDLVWFQDFECVKKTCAKEKGHTVTEYRMIVLPEQLYKYFDFPEGCEKKAFAFCVLHFKNELRDKICDGIVKSINSNMFNFGEADTLIKVRKSALNVETQNRLLKILKRDNLQNDFGLVLKSATQPGHSRQPAEGAAEDAAEDEDGQSSESLPELGENTCDNLNRILDQLPPTQPQPAPSTQPQPGASTQPLPNNCNKTEYGV